MKALGYILVGVGSAAIGFAAGYLIKKRKDEQYIHEQIVESRKSVEAAAERILNQFDEQGERILKKREEEQATDAYIPQEPVEKKMIDKTFTDTENIDDYLTRIHGLGYDDPDSYNSSRNDGDDAEYRNGLGETKAEEMERRMNSQPYRMENQNFGQFPDHELIGFTLYSDGILADDGNNRIYDSRELTGVSIADLMDMMRVIPEDEEKVLFFRNEKRQLDIEIISADETYSESIGIIDKE